MREVRKRIKWAAVVSGISGFDISEEECEHLIALASKVRQQLSLVDDKIQGDWPGGFAQMAEVFLQEDSRVWRMTHWQPPST